MAGQDTSTYDAVLRTVYQDKLAELIPQQIPTYEMFQGVDNFAWGGKFVEYEARVGRNPGSGWASEDGALPTAGRQQYVDVRIPMRYMYGRIRLTKQVMEHSSSSRFAGQRALSQEMQGLVKDMAAAQARTIFGDGRGILGFVNGTATSTTQTIDTPGGWTTTGATATNGSRFMYKGQVVATVNPATGALRASSATTIQTLPAAGTTITVSPSVTWTDNDYIVTAQNTSVTDVADTGYSKEAMGLGGLIDDGTNVATLHNVNRTLYPIYASTVIGSVGALSADVLQRGCDVADEKGGGEISDLIMHQAARRAYIAMTDAERRYMGADLSSPDAGTRAAKGGRITFGGIPIKVDKYAPYGTIFGIDRSGLMRYTAISGEWMQDDGSILKQIGTGDTLRDSYEAVYRIWQNFHNDFPARCFRLDGVTTSIVVVHND
jgi:hypothetical protein